MAYILSAPHDLATERPLHRIDPRVRIICATVFAITLVACHRLPVLLGGVIVALIVATAFRMPVRKTARRMAAMDGFILIMVLFLPFTTPGDPIVTVAGFGASIDGLRHAAEIAIRANAVVLVLLTLVGTMEPVVLGHALHHLRVPRMLVHLLMFTARYIDVLHAEYLRLRQAMKTRGFRPANTRHSWRSFGYLVGMMLVRAFDRSERILKAMKCRGFTGHVPLFNHFRLDQADWGFCALFATAICGLIAAEVGFAAV